MALWLHLRALKPPTKEKISIFYHLEKIIGASFLKKVELFWPEREFIGKVQGDENNPVIVFHWFSLSLSHTLSVSLSPSPSLTFFLSLSHSNSRRSNFPFLASVSKERERERETSANEKEEDEQKEEEEGFESFSFLPRSLVRSLVRVPVWWCWLNIPSSAVAVASREQTKRERGRERKREGEKGFLSRAEGIFHFASLPFFLYVCSDRLRGGRGAGWGEKLAAPRGLRESERGEDKEGEKRKGRWFPTEKVAYNCGSVCSKWKNHCKKGPAT